MEKKLLIETLTNFYRISGVKNPRILAESKATQAQGINILKRKGVENPEEVMNQLIGIDKSQNQKNLAAMAFLYAQGENNIRTLDQIFQEYEGLVNMQRVNPIRLTRQGIFIQGRGGAPDKTFQDYLSFSEYIHGITGLYAEHKDSEGDLELIGVDEPPIFSNEHFDIYDGNDVGKCIKYTQGGLTGKTYGWCIGQPANTNFQSYRDTKTSTFYFILDKQRDVNDPLHLVVYDNTIPFGIELTDRTNSTGTIAAPFGSDPEKYNQYLRSKGVPVEKLLVNKPKTEEETAEQAKLGRENHDLQWFIDLSFEEKSKYIGRGHTLSDDQFDYLLGVV